MAVDTIQLETTSSKTLRKGTLAKDLIAVAESDYLTVLRGIARQEIAGQLALGNKPSNMLIDGKPGANIDNAKYSVVAQFANETVMIQALNDAWRELQSIGASLTGTALQSFLVYRSDKRGEAPKAVAADPRGLNPAGFTSDTVIIIAGPMVPYGRKYRYYTRKGVKLKTRVASGKRYAGLAYSQRPRIALDIYQTVARKVRRKYPYLLVKDWWVKVNNMNPGGKTSVDRIGGVAVTLNKRGRI